MNRGNFAGPSRRCVDPVDLVNLVNENQSIKIIKPIDDIFGLSGTNLNFSDENIKEWLQNIQESWNLWKKSPNTMNLLHRFYENAENPYLYALKLIVNYRGDCKNNTLTYFTIEVLKDWSIPRFSEIAIHLNPDIKRAAFNISKEKNNAKFLKLTAETFHISGESVSALVMEMLKQKQFAIACHTIIALNLKIDGVIDSLLFPLALQLKKPLMDEYLMAFPDQAITFVKLLDSFMKYSNNFKDKIYEYMAIKKVTIGHVNWDHVHCKSFGKLISRICANHNIPLSICTNLTNNRAVGGLRFLIHQKYNKNISDNAWNDMVKDTINENPQLISLLITLVDHYNTRDACKWARFFNYPEESCPKNVRQCLQQNLDMEDEEDESPVVNSSQVIKYHELPPSIIIVFVDSPELFREAVYTISKQSIIGMDSEWKPSFGTKKSTVSLIQMATNSTVFLFDALKLNYEECSELWSLFSKEIFENPNISILGFGIQNDMREIKSSISGLKSLKYKDFNFIEIQALWKAVIHADIKLPYKKESSGEGLSAIVQECFGSILNKHEQCSNWEIRPLRQSQIDYAALDAYVLLEIFHLFDSLCRQLNLNVEEVCSKFKEKTRMKKIKKKPNIDKYKNCKVGPNTVPILAENTKLLLEPSLTVLARYLRCTGIDVELMSENELLEEGLQRAVKESQYVVLKHFNWKQISNLSKQIPRNHIYLLESWLAEEQVQEVFSYFNIIISKCDLFSRCDNCNCKELTIVSKDTVKKLKIQPKSSTVEKHNTNSQRVYHFDDDDECDDYGEFLSDKEDDDLAIVMEELNLSPENIDVGKCLTSFRVGIQVGDITDDIIMKNSEFLICQPCGKCFFKIGYLPENLLNLITYMMPNTSKN